MCSCLFPYYLPLQKGVAIILNKIKPFLHKDTLCQVWPGVLEKFFQVVQCIFNILLFPFGKGVAFPLNKL